MSLFSSPRWSRSRRLLISIGALALCRSSADGDRAMREALRESAREHQREEDGS
jgi:hypothetical protein